MRLLLSCVGRRGYVADYFRPHLEPEDRIIGTSNSHWTPGFAACDQAVLLPDIRSEQYVPALLDLCREERVDALLSFFDPDVDLLSRHTDALRQSGVVPILPSPQVSQISFDKHLTPRFLADAGLNFATSYVDLGAATSAIEAGTLKFPVVVKPRFGFGSKHLFVARQMDELNAFFGYEPDMMVQRWFAGDEFHMDLLNDLESNVVAVIPKKKTVMRAGETDQAVTVGDPALIELGEKLGTALGRLGHVGPMDVDLFVEDGEPFVLELNPRFGGGYPLSHLAGADFPGLLVSMLRGHRVAPRIGRFERDVMMMKNYAVLGGKLSEFSSNLEDRRSPQP